MRISCLARCELPLSTWTSKSHTNYNNPEYSLLERSYLQQIFPKFISSLLAIVKNINLKFCSILFRSLYAFLWYIEEKSTIVASTAHPITEYFQIQRVLAGFRQKCTQKMCFSKKKKVYGMFFCNFKQFRACNVDKYTHCEAITQLYRVIKIFGSADHYNE